MSKYFMHYSPRNQVARKGTWVRIPPSPPGRSRRELAPAFYSQCAFLQDSRLSRRRRMPVTMKPPDRSGRKGPLPVRCSGAALPGKSSIASRCPMTWDACCRAAGAAFPPAGRKRKTRPDRDSRSGRGTWRQRGFTAAAGGSGRRAGRRRAPLPWGSGRTRPRSGTGRRRP